MPVQRSLSAATSAAPSRRLWALSSVSWLSGSLLIAGLALLIYLPALNGDFILDDDLLLTNNALIKAPDGLFRFWYTTAQPDYVPLTSSTLWIEWRLWGMRPAGYHLTNLVLHIASALLIWAILRQLSIPGAFLAALLFTVHPVNVESVAWVEQRKNTLSMLFFLLSIFWYVKADRPAQSIKKDRSSKRTTSEEGGGLNRWYWLSLLAFALAMFSKGSVAIGPLLLLLIVWWRRGKITGADLARCAPFLLVAILLTPVIIWFVKQGLDTTIRDATLLERMLGAGGVVWFYLAKALAPIDLLFVYPQWHIAAGNQLWWWPALGALGVTAVLIKVGISRNATWGRPLLFAWAFFCIALLPVMGFTDAGFMRYALVADHYQHLALIGVVALVGAGFEYWRTQSKKSSVASPISAIALVVALCVLSWQQAMLYGGPITLYSSVLAKNPNCAMAHYNLGNSLFQNKQVPQAIGHYEMALRLDSNYPGAHENLGAALVSSGRPEEGIDHYQRAIQRQPDNYDALANMALAYAMVNRPTEAMAAADKALLLARLHGETALAEQIDDWLNSYRAKHSDGQAGPPAADRDRASP